MFRFLSICCFAVIVWILVSDPAFGDTKSRKSDEGGHTFVSALIGILISPFLAVGALLVFLLHLLGSVIPLFLFVVSSFVQSVRNLCSLIFSIVRRLWRSLASLGRLLAQSGLSMRAVRSLLRDVRSMFDAFAGAMRAAVHAFAAFLKRLVVAVHTALQRLFVWLRSAASACMRFLRRTVRRFLLDVRSLLTATRQTSARPSSDDVRLSSRSIPTATRQTSARSSSDAVRISSRSIRRRQTSRQWFVWLLPFAGWLFRSSRDDGKEEERRFEVARRKSSVHAVHGDRFSRRKQPVAVFTVSQITQGQIRKARKMPSHEADNFTVLPRIRQIGWQTRGRAQHLS